MNCISKSSRKEMWKSNLRGKHKLKEHILLLQSEFRINLLLIPSTQSQRWNDTLWILNTEYWIYEVLVFVLFLVHIHVLYVGSMVSMTELHCRSFKIILTRNSYFFFANQFYNTKKVLMMCLMDSVTMGSHIILLSKFRNFWPDIKPPDFYILYIEFNVHNLGKLL